MKVLVVYREDTKASSALPIPAVMEMVEASGHYIEELKKAGKILQGGFFAAGHGGYGVFEVKDLAELFDLSESIPVRPICSIEALPMLDVAEWAPLFKKQKATALANFGKLAAMMGGK